MRASPHQPASRPPTVSKSSARKAGTALRRILRGDHSDRSLDEVLATIDAYRTSFGTPMNMVTDALRDLLMRHSIDAEVSQRLKRMDTIVEKITRREKEIDLSRMQDIGGCRIVLRSADIDNLRTLRELVCDQWGSAVRRQSDYVATPRPSGYRAIHVVVEHDARLVEIQMRTQHMHQWAELVEGLSSVLGRNYKTDVISDDDDVVIEYTRLMSRLYSCMDSGEQLSPDEVARVTSLASEILGMLPRTREGAHHD